LGEGREIGKNSKTQLEAQHPDACELPVYKPNLIDYFDSICR